MDPRNPFNVSIILEGTPWVRSYPMSFGERAEGITSNASDLLWTETNPDVPRSKRKFSIATLVCGMAEW